MIGDPLGWINGIVFYSYLKSENHCNSYGSYCGNYDLRFIQFLNDYKQIFIMVISHNNKKNWIFIRIVQ